MTETHDCDSAGVDWDAIHQDQPSLAADILRDPQGQAAWHRSVAAHHALVARPGESFQGDETVAIALHPGFVTLDAIGARYVLSSLLGVNIHLATTGGPRPPRNQRRRVP